MKVIFSIHSRHFPFKIDRQLSKYNNWSNIDNITQTDWGLPVLPREGEMIDVEVFWNKDLSEIITIHPNAADVIQELKDIMFTVHTTFYVMVKNVLTPYIVLHGE